MFALATEEDCERARHDDGFRRKLVSDHLERLLDELCTLRKATPDPDRDEQLREGVELALRLAALLQK